MRFAVSSVFTSNYSLGLFLNIEKHENHESFLSLACFFITSKNTKNTKGIDWVIVYCWAKNSKMKCASLFLLFFTSNYSLGLFLNIERHENHESFLSLACFFYNIEKHEKHESD